MDIKDRIEKIKPYFQSMNIASENNIIYVLVQFHKGWACSDLTELNYGVKCVNAENPFSYYFFTNLEM